MKILVYHAYREIHHRDGDGIFGRRFANSGSATGSTTNKRSETLDLYYRITNLWTAVYAQRLDVRCILSED